MSVHALGHHGAGTVEHHYEMPHVAHGRANLSPIAAMAGVVDTSVLKHVHPSLTAIANVKEGRTYSIPNVVYSGSKPATVLPLGMVRLEMR